MKQEKIKTKRLFIGIPIPTSLADLLFEFSQKQRGIESIRWVNKENLHITTCFIGNIEVALVDDIISNTKKALAGVKPFSLTFEGLCIKPAKKPYMIWAKFMQNEHFEDMANNTCRLLIPGQRIRKNPIPHITMARFKKSFYYDNIDLDIQIEEDEIEVKKLILWESIQKPGGVEYLLLESFSLYYS
ncbi:MAG: RNA 2',3'-cyclic phosphodiesterase [Bacteroidota bacterium]